MRVLSFALLVICVLTVICSAAVAESTVEIFTYGNIDTIYPIPSSNQDGYGFTYQSIAMSPGIDEGGNEYFDWWYELSLRNNSADHEIVSWTYMNGGTVTDVVPNANPTTEEFSGSVSLPIPVATSPIYDDSFQHHEGFSDLSEKAAVLSVITFDDNTTRVVPIYLPANGSTVPEPGSLLAMATGLVSLLGIVRRRKA